MDEFEKLMAMITGQAEDALEKLGKEAELTNPRDAEHIKNVMKIMCYADKLMDGGDGYSNAGDWHAEGNYSRDGDTYAMRRGGYSRQHYSNRRDSRGRYSGMTMAEHLDAMEREAKTPEEREKIKKMRQMMR